MIDCVCVCVVCFVKNKIFYKPLSRIFEVIGRFYKLGGFFLKHQKVGLSDLFVFEVFGRFSGGFREVFFCRKSYNGGVRAPTTTLSC